MPEYFPYFLPPPEGQLLWANAVCAAGHLQLVLTLSQGEASKTLSLNLSSSPPHPKKLLGQVYGHQILGMGLRVCTATWLEGRVKFCLVNGLNTIYVSWSLSKPPFSLWLPSHEPPARARVQISWPLLMSCLSSAHLPTEGVTQSRFTATCEVEIWSHYCC